MQFIRIHCFLNTGWGLSAMLMMARWQRSLNFIFIDRRPRACPQRRTIWEKTSWRVESAMNFSVSKRAAQHCGTFSKRKSLASLKANRTYCDHTQLSSSAGMAVVYTGMTWRENSMFDWNETRIHWVWGGRHESWAYISSNHVDCYRWSPDEWEDQYSADLYCTFRIHPM